MEEYNEFWSRDRKYGLNISRILVREIYEYCNESGYLETGGTLIGYYNRSRDCAFVTAITPAPSDSRSGYSRFYRGFEGLQHLLDRFWVDKREYYLGEWHYHPACQSDPSGLDNSEILRISRDRNYNCPEPILIIVSRAKNRGMNIRAYVVSRELSLQKLLKRYSK